MATDGAGAARRAKTGCPAFVGHDKHQMTTDPNNRPGGETLIVTRRFATTAGCEFVLSY